MNSKNIVAALGLAAALTTLPLSAADEHGHDHDAPAAPSGPALPRFTAVSELFELVGVVDGKRLTIYLDRFVDNTPVKGATVELEVGGTKVALERHADGEFEGMLSENLEPGVIAVTATVVAGSETDLLAGELDLHEEAHAEEEQTHDWREYAPWGVGAVIALGALAWTGRRAMSARRGRVGGAA